jgi:hypothetical protein
MGCANATRAGADQELSEPGLLFCGLRASHSTKAQSDPRRTRPARPLDERDNPTAPFLRPPSVLPPVSHVPPRPGRCNAARSPPDRPGCSSQRSPPPLPCDPPGLRDSVSVSWLRQDRPHALGGRTLRARGQIKIGAIFRPVHSEFTHQLSRAGSSQ